VNTLIAQLIRPEIRALNAYHVPAADGFIKLDAMENPYSLPEPLAAEWREQLRGVEFNRYPDPTAQQLQRALREAMAIPTEMELLLGNGSDELIQMLALAVAASGRTILSVEPSFVMYRMIGLFAGMNYVGVPLNAEDFSIDVPAVLAAIERTQPALIYLAYPNNPTGNQFAVADMEQIITAAPGLVIIDEAYSPFTDASFLNAVGKWPNVLVMRTVSKMGLAGLRLGYLVGASEWLREIDKVRLPYNINVLTQLSATFALQHKAVFDAQTQAIRVEREHLFTALNQLSTLQVYPSEANFILVRTPPEQANRMFSELKTRRILIKNLHGAHPLLSDCLRLTVGLPEENAVLLSALTEMVN